MVDHVIQFKDFMSMYNRITENCFNTCVYDMNQRSLNPQETDCIHNCFFRHLNSNNRALIVFSEIQMKKQEKEHKAAVEAAATAQNTVKSAPADSTAT